MSDTTPVEAPPRRTAHAARSGAVAMVIAGLVLALTNSDALRSYVGGLPSSTLTEEALLLAEDWHAQMETHGLAVPKAELRARTQALQIMSWEDVRALLTKARSSGDDGEVTDGDGDDDGGDRDNDVGDPARTQTAN
ncbi:MAG: hypothetical protein AAFR04_10445 [Pseudomonadota bacterium]